MLHPLKVPNRSSAQGIPIQQLTSALVPITSVTIGLLGWAGVSPAIAHQVKTTDSVGATLHIEPNDTPQAGVPTEVWFALTRQGGESIPLADCDCQLMIYTQPLTPEATPLLNPPLSATSAEGYTAIPSAEVTFPNVGNYTLALTGAPKANQSFSPFELAFDVTVATGPSAPRVEPAQQPQAIETDQTTTEPKTTDSAPQTATLPETETPAAAWPLQFSQTQWQKPTILVLLILLVLGVGGVWQLRQKRSPKE
ncbi:MAG: hypothetical protein AAFW84_09105 [Cyanobacteria bacterium J06635_15]